MKKTLIYSAFILLLAAMACNKTDSTVSEEPIRFAFATDATRALVVDASGLRAQTMKVFDDMGTTPYYIDDKAAYSGGTWSFADNHAYTWRTGSHKFFAFTDGAGVVDADKKLTLTKTLTTADANQIDLLYSDIVTKEKVEGTSITSAVVIPMNHLFSAVGVMVKNGTSGAVTVNSVTAPAILNTGTAEIDFSGTTTAIEYDIETTASTFTTTTIPDAGVELASNGLADVFAQAAAEENTYWLVWPQKVAAEGLTVAIEYTIGTGTAAKKYTSEVKLPTAATEWKAGYKYLYTISINPHDIKLEFTVTDWVTNEEKTMIVE